MALTSLTISMSGYPDDLQPWSRAVIISVTILAFISVVLRILARFEKRSPLWWDDYFILISMAWNIIVIGFIFAMIDHGMGLQVDQVGMDNVVTIAKFLLVAEILYVYNLVWTKLSLLLFYYRLFRVAYFKRWAYIIGTFVILWVICITFLFIFICVPVQKVWTPDLPGHCIDQVGTWVANAASTILSDIAILVLPIPQVWKLQLRRSEKIALTFAFCLGFFVVFASAYRFTVLFTYDPNNPSYTLAPTVGWTAIEMAAGIISANLPSLRPAFRYCARLLGIKFSASGFLASRGTGNGTSKQANGSTDATRAASGMDIRLNDGERSQDDTFYRLDDLDGDSLPSLRGPSPSDGEGKLQLRPEQVGYSVKSVHAKETELAPGWDGDEVPLNRILVKKEFQHEVAKEKFGTRMI